MNRKIRIKTLWNRGIINSISLISKYIYARSFSLPYTLMIEPSDLCNLNCSICYTQKVKRKRETNFLILENFKKVIDNVKNHCVYINLWIAGEPLLNPELEKMVEYANKQNIITCISTNAMLLTKERTKNLIAAGVDRVIISFDGATKESYEKIRLGAKFETVVENIKHLIAFKKNKPLVSLQLVITKDNETEIHLFREMAKELKVDEAYTKTLYTASQLDQETSRKIISLIPTKERYIRKVRDRMKHCLARERAAIQCDGTVVPCCFDVQTIYSFGNAFNENFREIWRSKKYTEFRKNNEKFTKSPLCSACGCNRDYTLNKLL